MLDFEVRLPNSVHPRWEYSHVVKLGRLANDRNSGNREFARVCFKHATVQMFETVGDGQRRSLVQGNVAGRHRQS